MPDTRQPPASAETVIFTLHRPLLPLALFVRGGWRALFRSQGKLMPDCPRDLVAVMNGTIPDPTRLARYCHVCGYPPDGTILPPAFLETLFMSPLGKIVTSRAFPLSPMGLIHIGQTITPLAPLPAGASYDLTCRTDVIRETDRGVHLTVSLDAAVAGNLVWQGTAEFLSRSPATIKRGGRRKHPPAPELEPTATCRGRHRIDVPPRTGWDYARASGDYNPHHLNRWTARPLGYRRPIAHGMWSLARCLAEIERQVPRIAPYEVHAAFKAPVFMPAVTTLSWNDDRTGGSLAFQLTDARHGQPHVVGTLRPL